MSRWQYRWLQSNQTPTCLINSSRMGSIGPSLRLQCQLSEATVNINNGKGYDKYLESNVLQLFADWIWPWVEWVYFVTQPLDPFLSRGKWSWPQHKFMTSGTQNFTGYYYTYLIIKPNILLVERHPSSSSEVPGLSSSFAKGIRLLFLSFPLDTD